MSNFTAMDVERGLFALDTAVAGYLVRRGHADRDMVRTVLAAVLPAHDRRVRAEALKNAADVWDAFYADDPPDAVSIWLRRTDAEDGKP